MCTSFICNKSRPLVGWNLDLLGMEHRVVAEKSRVYIAVKDKTEGWLPLFGANARGDFVAMPTCWPHDNRSDPASQNCRNIIRLNIELILGSRSFSEVLSIAKSERICSEPGITFMSQLTDRAGNALQIVPGQGTRYFERPEFLVLTNFSPFKEEGEIHPFMGLDRYKTATQLLQKADSSFSVDDAFSVLQNVAQTEIPTVVSMVFDPENYTVYWCENRDFSGIKSHKISP